MSWQTVYNWLGRDSLVPKAHGPRLHAPSIVVLDNASFHKKKDIAAIPEKGGHVMLPLPPYSPDFNPIENCFGALKRKREAVRKP